MRQDYKKMNKDELERMFANPYALDKKCDLQNIELVNKLNKLNTIISNELEEISNAMGLLGLPVSETLYKMSCAILSNSEKMREEYSQLQYEAADMELRGTKNLMNSILTMALDTSKDQKRLSEDAALLAESQGLPIIKG